MESEYPCESSPIILGINVVGQEIQQRHTPFFKSCSTSIPVPNHHRSGGEKVISKIIYHIVAMRATPFPQRVAQSVKCNGGRCIPRSGTFVKGRRSLVLHLRRPGINQGTSPSAGNLPAQVSYLTRPGAWTCASCTLPAVPTATFSDPNSTQVGWDGMCRGQEQERNRTGTGCVSLSRPTAMIRNEAPPMVPLCSALLCDTLAPVYCIHQSR